MTSSTSQSNHAYVIIRLKISENVNGLTGSMFCHYDETDDVFLIGGSVEPNKTLMASAIRHCRRLVDFRLKPCHRLYLAKVINGLVDHEPLKIYIYVVDVLFKDLGWRARHHTPRMANLTVDHINDIVASYEGQPCPLHPVEIPTSLTIQNAYGTTDEFSIYSWNERVGKSRCFDFGEFLTAIDIENNLGTDVEIIPCFWGDIRIYEGSRRH